MMACWSAETCCQNKINEYLLCLTEICLICISLVLYFRTGCVTHRVFYPVRIRGSVPRCKASSVATNSSSSSLRLYGDMRNLRLLLLGKWGLGFSGILGISLKNKDFVWSSYFTVLYAITVCVCVHVYVLLLYITYVIVSYFNFECYHHIWQHSNKCSLSLRRFLLKQ
jgi:hypothetical protein